MRLFKSISLAFKSAGLSWAIFRSYLSLAGLLFSILLSRYALGCDCAPRPEPEAAVKNADAVFIGIATTDLRDAVVSESREGDRESLNGDFRKYWDVSFEAKVGFKGIQKERVTISVLQSTCLFPFKKGKAYLIYASKTQNGRLTTHICSRTGELSDPRVMEKDLSKLPPVFVQEREE